MISTTHINKDIGWLVGGGFNEILYDYEKKGGNPRPFTLIDNFRNAFNTNSLSSLKSYGPVFTDRKSVV